MQHIGTKTILTPRLVLRRLTAADADAMYTNWASDAEMTRYLRWPPHENARATAELLRSWETSYADPETYQWGIALRKGGELIGSISLMRAENESPATWQAAGLDFSAGVWEPGYCIGRAWWGLGYTSEALGGVCGYWFNEAGGSWLACCHAAQNPASGRVMQKNGFVYDHDAICHKFDGTPVGFHVYLLKKPGGAAGTWGDGFRPAMPRDLPPLKALYRGIVRRMEADGLRIWDEVYPCEFLGEDIANGRLYLWEEGGIRAAFALCGPPKGESGVVWRQPGAPALYLDRLGVGPNDTGRGAGRAMLQKARQTAKALGAEWLRLLVVNTNLPAIRLYEACGFARAGGMYEEHIGPETTLREYGYELRL